MRFMRFLTCYFLLFADEEELHSVTTATRFERFAGEIRQDHEGILGERKLVLRKLYFQLIDSEIFILYPFTEIGRSG